MSGIVVIEEDKLMQGLILEWLRADGYAVRTSDGPDAATGDADVVVVDIHRPRESGQARLHAVQSAYPGAPVIAISGQFRPGLTGDGAAARALGARQVIAKPFNRGDLLAAVRAVVGPP